MGTYISQSDIEAVFGEQNVETWSQLDPDESGADTDAIASAIAYAEADVENRFRNCGLYAIPFSPATNPTVKNWCAIIAGIWLFQRRPDPGGDPSDSWSAKQERVDNEIELYVRGARRLPCTLVPTGATAPYPLGVDQ